LATLLSILQQGFRGALVLRKTCSGVAWGFVAFFYGKWFLPSVRRCVIMKIFRSLCCIQISSRPVSCTGGWVQLIAAK